MRKNKTGLLTSHILMVLIISAAVYSFSGCGDSVTNSTVAPNKYQARSEGEFNSSASLKAFPGAVIFVDLEDLNSPAGSSGNDTGPIGEDVIPYTYTETATHRIRLGEEVQFKARLLSESGEVIYQLNNPNDTVRVSIPAGNYKLHLTSLVNYGSDTLGTQAVFVQPDLESIGLGGESLELYTLMRTRKCVNCDFNHLVLYDYNLSYTDISYSDFSECHFYKVKFSGATFNHTDFSKAYLNTVNFSNAVFDSTNLSEMDLQDMEFIGTKFTNCYLKNTSFRNFNYSGYQFVGAQFTDCDCQGVNFFRANLTNAILIDVDIRYAGMCLQNRTGAVFSNIEYNRNTECWP